MSNKNFQGYCEEFPIKPGQVITIPKGTLVTCRGVLSETKRSTKVKVNHVLSGMSIPVGYFHAASGKHGWSYCTKDARQDVQKVYGTTDLDSLWPLMKVDGYGHISLPYSNPEVVWAGPGGYWKSADLNQLFTE